MAAKEIKIRRGTAAENDAFTGAEGEVTVSTDEKRLIVHDGITPGGFPVASPHLSNVFTQTQFIQGGNLDVEGNAEFVTNEIILSIAGLTVGAVSLVTPTFLGLDGSVIAADGNFSISPAGNVVIGGSLTLSYRAVVGTDTFSATDYTIDCTANTFTLNLPTAVGIAGRIYVAKNSGVGVITVDANGAETIDGLADFSLLSGESVSVQSSGAHWIVI